MVLFCVDGYSNPSHITKGSERSLVSFYRFPSYVGTNDRLHELAAERLRLWLLKLNIVSIADGTRICREHFISGMHFY